MVRFHTVAVTLSENDADVSTFLPVSLTPYCPTSAAFKLLISNLNFLLPSELGTTLVDSSNGWPSFVHVTKKKTKEKKKNELQNIVRRSLIFNRRSCCTFRWCFVRFTVENDWLPLSHCCRLRENFEGWTFHIFGWYWSSTLEIRIEYLVHFLGLCLIFTNY